MSAAASELELRSEKESNEKESNEIPDDPRSERTLDVLAHLSPPGYDGPVIACDLDDVLSQTNVVIAKWHNEQYGTKMTLDDFYYFYYWKNPYWGGLQVTYDKVRDFYASMQMYEALPVPGAREGVQTLHDMGFKLIVVTARSQEVQEDSWKWINKWFPGLFHSVVCTGQFKEAANKNGFEVSTKLSKAQVCANLKARLLIDDSSENALQMTKEEPDIPVLLFGEYEWNKRLSSHADAVDAMVFDTRLQIEGGREFWKDESFEDHVPEGAAIQRVKDWGEAVRWVKAAQAENRL